MSGASESEIGRPESARWLLWAALIALVFTLLWHLAFGDAHFKPDEEGYLWYGVERASAGELPLRDFQSYDPGRYLLCAALGWVLGDGLNGLHRSLAVVQAVGLFFALLAARRATRSVWLLIPIAIVLGSWMFPRYKVFECALSQACVWAGVRLLEHPTRRRHLAAGIVVGLAGFFGRNLGLYAALGTLVLLGLSALKRRDADWKGKTLVWSGGVALGYAPMLALFLAPGFASSFVRSFELLLRLGANIEEPWPWPWRIELAGLTPFHALEAITHAAIGCLPPIVLACGWWSALRARAEDLPRHALVLSGAIVGTFFMHHAAVRSDPTHLAQSIHPILLATIGFLAPRGALARLRAALLAILAALFALGAYAHNYSVMHLFRLPLTSADLGGSEVRLLYQQADYYERLQRTIGGHLGPEDSIFFAPSRPGFYPMFHRRSPSWWIYFFVPDADRAEQEAVIAELGDVEWVLIVDVAIGKREELRFQNSYELVWDHIVATYEPVATPDLEQNHCLFRRRGAGRNR